MTKHTDAAPNRRKTQRQYLARHIPVELVHGQRRIAIESAWISDISPRGIGLHSTQPIALSPGAQITLATTRGDHVLTIPGRIVSVRHGHEFGIETNSPEARDSLRAIAETTDSVAVTNPQQGRTQVSGRFTMAARHPIQWAIQAGAKRIDMRGSNEIDSSGLGLLLLMNERNGLQIENCPSGVCRTIGLVGIGRICAPDCPQRGTAKA